MTTLTPSKLTFFVPGKPATAGSKKGFPIRRPNGSIGVVMAPDNKRARPWMAAVADAAMQHAAKVIDGAVCLLCEFEFLRPKGHYGTGRNASVLKPSAPKYHTKKPDCTKLARCVEDALTKVTWRDDSQVVELHVRKTYSSREGVSVTIEELA